MLVERDGVAVCAPLANIRAAEIRKHILAVVSTDSMLVTDEFPAYIKTGRMFAGGHERVSHSKGEYARDKDGLSINSNTAESFFALLKRGHYGIFHQLSKRHLERYCREFAFRWTHRKMSDGHRMVAAINGAEGKRLKYR